jgi:ATP phosphoribosyltransferase
MIKIALPKGRLKNATADFLRKTEINFSEYYESSRCYLLESLTSMNIFAKVFHEKDIATQVAIGNYDLGICGSDWIEEFLVSYPNSSCLKIRELSYGQRSLHIVKSLAEVRKNSVVRLVSEYPNLAKSFALKSRFPHFKVFPVWGKAESYLPEHAELALISISQNEDLSQKGLISLTKILSSSAFLIANKDSLKHKDLSSVLKTLCSVELDKFYPSSENCGRVGSRRYSHPLKGSEIFLALPDGHQQPPLARFLKEKGLKIKGYSESACNAPQLDFEGINLKVIRPQDMPLQVANGNFDLAITGRDWLFDHLYRFPSSPARELLSLPLGKVRIVAVVSEDFPVDNTEDLRKLLRRKGFLRIASEYVNISDKFARDNHLSPCKVIPTWGATEAFLPEDADILIENTETGETLKRNNLKIIKTLFESSACLIGNDGCLSDPLKKEKAKAFVKFLGEK